MTPSVFFITVAVAGISSLVTSAVLLLLGGYGGYIKTTQALNQHADELERLETKITREVKARASVAGKKPDEYQDLLSQLASSSGSALVDPNNPVARRAALKQRSRHEKKNAS